MQHALQRPDISTVLRPLELCVVVPVLNERPNITELIDRVANALVEIEWEIMFVDDGSRDGTPELVSQLAATDRRIRLIRRFNRRGLSSAVIEGMMASTAPVVAVIDGDLQHDEMLLPKLYRAIAEDRKEVAVGTRYSSEGSIGKWDQRRARISAFATRLAEVIARTPLSDPMSGFFAVRRDTLTELAPRLSGIGYKILLDIMASASRPLDVAEFPYTFRTRQHGESKLDSTVVLQYLEMLVEKKIGHLVPIKFLKFSCVGAIGLGIHMVVLFTLLSRFSFGTAQTVAVLSAMTFNFLLNNSFTYRDQRLAGLRMLTGLLSFYAICGLGAIANVGVGKILFGSHYDWWLAGLAGAVVGSVWNYVMGSLFTWRKSS
ncbi:glycosyltransferase [Sphingobium sp. Cam5-1]|uniref:glycosyltransferase n=1 Tax=Sphingobium sp. Cam5-1 TaxID=2789327 RepID=UPI0018AD2215|nr:glycosyltransferase family 2 protein [Sphingobium sp. Cam5-1]QPI71944.1 glycosyltransferase family 2 protein [Sphingobium sp. Cam5-1]